MVRLNRGCALIENIIGSDFSGAALVKQNNGILLQRAFGYADINNKIPNEADTKFATASAGKVFVATAILQLIEEGRLHFDDTIGTVLDFDLKAIDKNITVKQLLNHTSGIPDYFDENIMTEYAELWKDFPNYKIRKSMDMLPLFIHKPMMYAAGEKFQYNNTGFVVLGLIIEKITNLPFDEYLQKNVFEFCEMYSTGYYELDRLPAKCANAYIYDERRKEYYTNIYSVDAKGTGAGGAFTTIMDIGKFWSNLLGKKLLSEKTVNQMFSLQSHSGSDYYGYGIWLEKTGGGTYEPFFQGADPGVSFISGHNRKKDLTITLVSNRGDNVWKIKREIEQVFQT
jgi:CubicO group peptidase (beta-lactamase class C family)